MESVRVGHHDPVGDGTPQRHPRLVKHEEEKPHASGSVEQRCLAVPLVEITTTELLVGGAGSGAGELARVGGDAGVSAAMSLPW